MDIITVKTEKRPSTGRVGRERGALHVSGNEPGLDLADSDQGADQHSERVDRGDDLVDVRIGRTRGWLPETIDR